MSETLLAKAQARIPMDSPMLGALLLGFCMFTTGGAGLVIQYVIATVTTNILGASIIVWSLVIGVMLGSMGLSGWLQERIGEERLLEKFVAIEIILALAGGFAPIVLTWADGSFAEHFNLVLYSWIVMIGAMIGLEIPIVMRIIEKQGIKLKHNLKYVFAADYLGSMFFMFVWVYYWLPNVPVMEVGFLVASINFTVALVTIIYFGLRGGFKNAAFVLTAVLLSSATLVYGYSKSSEWSISLNQKLFDDPIVYETTTRYQHLVVTRATNTRCGDEIRLYINGNTQFGSCDENIYHDNLVHPAMTLAGQADKILILGGGDGLALRDVLTYQPAEVMLVDLDPDMVRIARDNEYLNALNRRSLNDVRVVTPETQGVTQDGGLFQEVRIGLDQYEEGTKIEKTELAATIRRMHIDAAKFLEVVDEAYDVVIIDLPDPSSVELARLYTKEFYTEIRRKLRPGGLMVVQSTSPIHAREVYLEIGRTIEAGGMEAIPYHDNVPSFGDWGFWLACHEFGCRDRLSQKIAKLDSFGADTMYLTPDRFRSNLSFGLVDGKAFTQSATSDRLNTNADPTIFVRYVNDAWKGY